MWTTQKGAVIPIPEDGPLPAALEILRDHGRKMTCWLPLTTAHRRVGVLSFGSRSDAAYTADALAFMEQVAAIVAIAADNGINYEQAQRYGRELRDERDQMRFLLDVNNLLVTHLEYPALLEAICDAVRRVIEADVIGVALFDQDAGELRLDVVYDKVGGFKSSGVVLPLDRSAAGVTLQRGVAGVFRRTELEALGWDSASVRAKANDVESVCCVPLVTHDRKLGTLFVGSALPDAFSADDVTLLGQTSAQIAIAVENARAYESITVLNSRLQDASLPPLVGSVAADELWRGLAVARVDPCARGGGGVVVPRDTCRVASAFRRK